MMETRGRSPSQARLRRRFLRFCRIAPGWRVVEVGSGSGVVARDVAALVGPRGHVTGVDRSRVLLAAARRRAREEGLEGRLDFRLGEAAALSLRSGRFDCFAVLANPFPLCRGSPAIWLLATNLLQLGGA